MLQLATIRYSIIGFKLHRCIGPQCFSHVKENRVTRCKNCNVAWRVKLVERSKPGSSPRMGSNSSWNRLFTKKIYPKSNEIEFLVEIESPNIHFLCCCCCFSCLFITLIAFLTSKSYEYLVELTVLEYLEDIERLELRKLNTKLIELRNNSSEI